MPEATDLAPQVLELRRETERERVLGLLKLGATKDLSVGQLLDRLPEPERHILERVIHEMSSQTLVEAIVSTRSLDTVFGSLIEETPVNGHKRRRKKLTPNDPQQELRGLDDGPKRRPETVAFDKRVVRYIAAEGGLTKGVKSGQICEALECSRGKLRLAFGRLKSSGYVEQMGTLNAARYVVTPAGLTWADPPKTDKDDTK